MSASNRRQKIKVNKKRISLVVIVLFALLATLFASCIKTLTYKNVYDGVYVDHAHVGGMSEDELRTKISEVSDFSRVYDITITVDDVSETISTLALSPSPDTDKMVETVMEYGRTKKGLARFGEIRALKKNKPSVPLMITFDEFALQRVLDKIASELNITATDNKLEIGTDSLTITRGVKGRGIVYEDVKKAVADCLLHNKNTVSLGLKEIEPEEITVDFIKRYTSEKPVDATYTISNHRLVLTESRPGITFNEKIVKQLLKENANNAVFTIPVTVKEPSETEDSIRSSLFGDELGTFKSDFSDSSADRAYNIKLACDKIDGYVLAPGEEFSYNEVVGPRTAERGFRMANVYVGNTVQPGIGGGICQVSSTMFNAVVYADLEITSRRNHTLPVSYVPMGRDATVSYGSVDFKFKNTYDKPIEIRAICEGRKNIVTIYGIDENPERRIEIQTVKTGTFPPKVVQKEDDTLPEGEIKVESKGTNGSSYVAYKVVYENGVKVSSDVLCKSTYAGKDRVEFLGTKKAELPPEEPVLPETPIVPVNPAETQATPNEEPLTAQTEE